MIFIAVGGIFLGQLIWTILNTDLGLGLISFLIGIVFTLVVLTVVLIQGIKWLPTHLFPHRNNFNHTELNSGQLEKSGWLRISTLLVTEKVLFNEPFDFPQQFTQSVKTSSQLESAIKAKNYILDRFHGVEPKVKPTSNQSKNWRNVFAKLTYQSLTLYSSGNQEQILLTINIPDTKIKLIGESDYHYDPILLKFNSNKLYIYCPTSSEKEDWFCKLSRCKKLPNGFREEKIMEFYGDLEPVKAYESGMLKLQSTLKDLDSDSPVWLNALLGRAFISIHSNPSIKLWIMENITRRMAHVHRTSTSFLGDIVIKDLDVGNSLPIISNPRLLAISNDGDMEIELDLDYTGGISLEVATAASISVPAWTEYMRPINVPIVVKVSITSFSARMLLKIKPLWETNRIWFGFYRHPELKLELNVEPIISDKLVKIELVNQVIEGRIKQALEEFVILPNMDSIVFWPFPDAFEDGYDSSDEEISDQERDSEPDDNITDEDLDNLVSFTDDVSVDSNDEKDTCLNYVGEAAFKIGNFVRENGIDIATKSLAKKISTQMDTYLSPTVNFIQDISKPYRDLILEETKIVGLDIVNRLGLAPDLPNPIDSNIPLGSQSKKIRKSSSRTLDVMGLKISTHVPDDSELDVPTKLRRKRKIMGSEPDFRKISESDLEPSEFGSSLDSIRLSESFREIRKEPDLESKNDRSD